ncbi:MAG: TonB-dependent receptor [Bacteroidales bacterium]|nr:TonB-dependent receptor [Bacteroidales bacterium]MDD5892397.1 TonB-dependent receptor [Bacteroidales bacterium]MDY5357106.1 TonB-dependent receptor [Candidatus Cryptobacteroides sp.]
MQRFLLSLLALCLCLGLSAQNIKVSGQVVSDEDSQPLPGVSVIVKGMTRGTSTDLDGNFSIEIPSGSSLLFSCIGYEDKTVSEFNGENLIIRLKTDSFMLDEVVAIGYGVMKKSDLTGSVSSVKGDQLKKTPAAGLDQALQGVAAGVTVNACSGQPGAAAEVRIRGIGTVNNSSPIYVVDGVIVDNINYLSPSDITSTEILKDASATAIYGSRGANGVILVTTKKGSDNGKINVSLDAYVGIQNRWRTLDLMNSEEFASFLATTNADPAALTTLKSSGIDAFVRGFLIGKSNYYPKNLDYSTIDTDWQDVAFKKNAVIQNYYVSVDGGNQKGYWSMSANWFNQLGTIIGSDYTRTSIRVNSAYDIAKWLRIGENLTFMTSHGRNAMNNSSSAGASVISAAIAMAPWDPARYPDGAVNRAGDDLSGQISAASNFKNVTNPLSMVEHSHPSDKTDRWVGDIFLEIKPINGLIFRSDVSMDLTNTRHKLFKDKYKYSDYDKADKNFIESSVGRYQTIIVENTLTYARDIKKHSFSAMVGQTTEQYQYETIGGSGSSILNPVSTNWYLSQATEDQNKASDSAGRTRRFSLLSRLHYSYDSRYMVTVNFRADGSSKFAEHPWGYFPSAALAWRLKNESFLKNVSWMEDLKLRLGWGMIGNDKIGDNAFILNMMNTGPTFVDYVFGQEQALASGATILTYVNNGGKWETTEQWNLGIDFGFWGNRLTGNVDLFQRDTKDMLLSVTAPAQVGNRYAATANVGTVRNSGIEITLNHRNDVGDFSYSIGGNISFIKNELTALNGGEKVWGDKTVCDQGLPLYTFWGYRYDGIFRTQEEIDSYLWAEGASTGYAPGDAKYFDKNNDGKIDENDKMALGNPFPWLTYGLNFSAEWKGIDLQVFFQGVYGNEIYNALRLRTEGTGNEATLSTSMRNVWTRSNPDGSIPNPFGNPINSDTNSRFIESGAYLRLKNVQLGYTLPQRWTQKIKMSRCRIYLSGNNLFTATKYSGYDPEVGGGVDYGNYPQSRTFMLGLNINF